MNFKISHCSRIIFMVDVVMLLFLQVSQGAALNYYIIKQFSEYFTAYFLFLLDFLCLFFFIGTMAVCYNHFARRNTTNLDDVVRRRLSHPHQTTPKVLKSVFGVLPLCYISWLVYIIILIGKVLVILHVERTAIIFSGHNFSSQLLLVVIGMSCLVFLLLVEGHNWNKVSSKCYSYVMVVAKKTAIEIFDAIEMFQLLMEDDNITGISESLIYILACINFILPTISLYELSVDNFGQDKPERTLKSVIINIIHSTLKLFLIDVPFLSIRLYLWLVYHEDTSMFMLKNLFYIILAVRELYIEIYDYNSCKKKIGDDKTAENYVEIPLNEVPKESMIDL